MTNSLRCDALQWVVSRRFGDFSPRIFTEKVETRFKQSVDDSSLLCFQRTPTIIIMIAKCLHTTLQISFVSLRTRSNFQLSMNSMFSMNYFRSRIFVQSTMIFIRTKLENAVDRLFEG